MSRRDAMGRECVTPAELARLKGVPLGPQRDPLPADRPTRKPWSSAVRTVCAAKHAHPSKLEAHVCAALAVQAKALGSTVYRQVRYPLLSLAPKPDGTPYTVSIDFVIPGVGIAATRHVDSKGRKDPAWMRGAAAFAAEYHTTVELVTGIGPDGLTLKVTETVG
jgi:hypothetical protein